MLDLINTDHLLTSLPLLSLLLLPFKLNLKTLAFFKHSWGLLLVDDHNRKLLFQTIQNTILREDDFNKFQILSTKVNNILEIIEQESNDFKLIYNIIKQQCMYAISALDYLHEKLQEINKKYEQLKKTISDEKHKLYVDNELSYNKHGPNKIQSIISAREISKEKFRQSM